MEYTQITNLIIMTNKTQITCKSTQKSKTLVRTAHTVITQLTHTQYHVDVGLCNVTQFSSQPHINALPCPSQLFYF